MAYSRPLIFLLKIKVPYFTFKVQGFLSHASDCHWGVPDVNSCEQSLLQRGRSNFFFLIFPLLSSVVSTRVIFSDRQGHGDGSWPDCCSPGRSSETRRGGGQRGKTGCVNRLKMRRAGLADQTLGGLPKATLCLGGQACRMTQVPSPKLWGCPLARSILSSVYFQLWSWGQPAVWLHHSKPHARWLDQSKLKSLESWHLQPVTSSVKWLRVPGLFKTDSQLGWSWVQEKSWVSYAPFCPRTTSLQADFYRSIELIHCSFSRQYPSFILQEG